MKLSSACGITGTMAMQSNDKWKFQNIKHIQYRCNAFLLLILLPHTMCLAVLRQNFQTRVNHFLHRDVFQKAIIQMILNWACCFSQWQLMFSQLQEFFSCLLEIYLCLFLCTCQSWTYFWAWKTDGILHVIVIDEDRNLFLLDYLWRVSGLALLFCTTLQWLLECM